MSFLYRKLKSVTEFAGLGRKASVRVEFLQKEKPR